MSAEVVSETLPPNIPAEEIPKDLGFGTVVTQESRLRLVNRDGSFNVRRTGLAFWPSLSPYHLLLTVSWSKFLGLTSLYFILINTAFALAYLACGAGALSGPPVAQEHSAFWQAFFFSVHTFATIGYGNISAVGMAANLIVVVESLAGLLATALVTGLIFARFSRPTAKIVFSKQAVMAPYNGITGFMFRITNARKNQLINLEVRVNLSLYSGGKGPTNRRFYQLKLERSYIDFFPLSWTIVHPIDEDSPLQGYTAERLKQEDAEFIILLTGLDDSISQNVHTRSSYKHQEIVWNAKFSSIYEPIEDKEPITIDVGKIHDIQILKE
jgi:inward rectifier potassium channel